jgi:hypothetical protein
MSAGKGDTPRPINHDKYRTNYNLIFRKYEHSTKHSDHDDHHKMGQNGKAGIQNNESAKRKKP